MTKIEYDLVNTFIKLLFSAVSFIVGRLAEGKFPQEWGKKKKDFYQLMNEYKKNYVPSK